MKKLMLLTVAALMSFSQAPAQGSVSFGAFYSSLGPQGEWISIDGGSYGWHPSGVGDQWRPYSEGQWVWTDDGWYWSSDEPWGWATYHYGRWYYDDYYGWVWVPGYEWAPAWVEWRYGGGCVGWAPLSPYAVFSVGWGIHYRRYWATPYNYWCFVNTGYMCSPNVNRYVYRPGENTRFIGRTRTAGSVRFQNGRILTRGPEREFVEREGNIRVPRMEMVDVRERTQAGLMREGDHQRIAVYRPQIDATSRSALSDRPERVLSNEHRLSLDPRGTDLRRGETVNAERSLTRPSTPDTRIDRPSRDVQRPLVRPERPVRTPGQYSGGWRAARPERAYAPRSAPSWNSRNAPRANNAPRAAPPRSSATDRGGVSRGERGPRR